MLSRTLRFQRQSRSTLTRTYATARHPHYNLEKQFAKLVFSADTMKSRVSADVYKRFNRAVQEGTPVEPDVADAIAHAMKEWALSHGCTHFTHWFQPLTGWPAEKHDSFISLKGYSVETQFKGKALVGGETDGSSFPNGGLRPTHSARGYTIWDPRTPAWINTEGGVPTLCIPTCFYSWKGHALDKKLPLLRASDALKKNALKLFQAIGLKGHNDVFSDSGIEQEFFLVRENLAFRRPDIIAAGRTLQGSHPAKTQQLSDHYFAPLPSHALQFIHEVEQALWTLGIPVTTRHQEVAPNQFEWAPIFQKSSVASDYNMLAMEVLRRVAEKQGLTVLFHEKPFARVNGSGKHNNWSIGTNLIGTLFDPGNDAANNHLFLLSVAALLRGLNEHPDLLRWAISGIGNDHRLGGHEAPPAIISVYLGDYIGALVDSIISGKPAPTPIDPHLDLGVGHLPRRDRDNTDRNRTSPVAFTGNKFEVRGVGASQNPAHSNYVLNVLMADSFGAFAEDIQKKIDAGASADAAVRQLVREQFMQHQRIINDGDGYSAEWPAEAARRGLVNLKDTVMTLDHVNSQKSRDLLSRHGVLSEEEFAAHITVDYANYSAAALLEGQCLRDMSNKDVIPAAITYQNRVNQNSNASGLQKKLSTLINSSFDLTEKLSEACAKLSSISDETEGARYAVKTVVPLTKELRKALDALEDIVDRKDWPYPSYEELLLSRLAKESE